MIASHDKFPRHYATEILALPETARAEELARVPACLREWVRFYVDEHDQYFLARGFARVAASIVKRPGRTERQRMIRSLDPLIREQVMEQVSALWPARAAA